MAKKSPHRNRLSRQSIREGYYAAVNRFALLLTATTMLSTTMLTATAFADVVEPEPEDCVEGTSPDTCHGGPHCVPNRCATDEDCDGDFVCEEREYCVDTINCAGMLGPGEDPRDYDRDVIVGQCRGDCGGACNFIRLCVPPLPSGEGGGGCNAGGTPTGLALLLFALGIALYSKRVH